MVAKVEELIAQQEPSEQQAREAALRKELEEKDKRIASLLAADAERTTEFEKLKAVVEILLGKHNAELAEFRERSDKDRKLLEERQFENLANQGFHFTQEVNTLKEKHANDIASMKKQCAQSLKRSRPTAGMQELRHTIIGRRLYSLPRWR